MNIARISQAKIIAVSYASSRFITFNSWDQFKLPLPFSKICFFIDEQALSVPRQSSEQDIVEYEKILTQKLNFSQQQADKLCHTIKNLQ